MLPLSTCLDLYRHLWPCLYYLCLCTLAVPNFFFFTLKLLNLSLKPLSLSRDYLIFYLSQKDRQPSDLSNWISFLPLHILPLSLRRLSSCSSLVGRIGLLQAQMLCLWDPLVPKDGALSVWFCHLHHCPLTLPMPFPLLINIPRFAHLTKTSAVLSLLSPAFSFLFIPLFLDPLFPKLGDFYSMSAGVLYKSVLCFRNSILSLPSVMGFSSRSVVYPVLLNLLAWFWCPLPCPSSSFSSIAYWPPPFRCLSQHGWNQIYLEHSRCPVLFIGKKTFFLNAEPLKQLLLLAFFLFMAPSFFQAHSSVSYNNVGMF